MIIRPQYLNILKTYRDIPLVKILAGIRRCGKSTILEMLRDEVYIGKNETKEIDFVAVRRDERIYVQVCRRLPEGSDREVANLLEIRDHYPKYVVTLDVLAAGNINGVKILHLADFLLSKEY